MLCAFGDRRTVAGWKRSAPVPRGSTLRSLCAAWEVTLFTADRAGRIVAEVPQRVGANQASMPRVFLSLTGHNWKEKPHQIALCHPAQRESALETVTIVTECFLCAGHYAFIHIGLTPGVDAIIALILQGESWHSGSLTTWSGAVSHSGKLGIWSQGVMASALKPH